MSGAFIVVAALSAGNVYAGSDGDSVGRVVTAGARTATVSYADLDMTDVDAQRTFRFRVSRAAAQVCGSSKLRDVGSLSRAIKNKQCHERAMTNALRQVSHAQVAAVGK